MKAFPKVVSKINSKASGKTSVGVGGGACDGWFMCLEVGTDGGNIYGYDRAGGWGALVPDTFLNVPVYSLHFDVTTGERITRMGVNGDEMTPNVESVVWEYEGYDTLVTNVWDDVNKWYVGTDQALADHIAANLGERIGARPRPLYSYNPLEAHPDWYLESGDLGPTPTRWDDGVISFDSFPGQTVLSYMGIEFNDGEVSATILDDIGASNNTPSMLLSLRALDVDNWVGLRIYNGLYEVYDRIDGVFTKLGDIPNLPGANRVTLSVVGDQITLDIDGSITTYTTSHLIGGWPGIIFRGWEDVNKQVMDNYALVMADGLHIGRSGDPDFLGFSAAGNPERYGGLSPITHGISLVRFNHVTGDIEIGTETGEIIQGDNTLILNLEGTPTELYELLWYPSLSLYRGLNTDIGGYVLSKVDTQLQFSIQTNTQEFIINREGDPVTSISDEPITGRV